MCPPPPPTGLVQHDFTAGAPCRFWVAAFTSVATWHGFVHVAFVSDPGVAGEPARVMSPGRVAARTTSAPAITPETQPASGPSPRSSGGRCATQNGATRRAVTRRGTTEGTSP